MDVIESIRIRRSVRRYLAQPIEEDVLNRLLDALRFAPSACNYQPWRFIVVRDRQMREAIARASCEQMFMAQAPIIVVGCGFPEKAYKTMGGYGNSVDIDLAIAIDHLTLAAAECGLGTCWIGAFDERAVKNLLAIPGDVKVVAMTPLGYPAESGLLRPVEDKDRKPREEIIAFEEF